MKTVFPSSYSPHCASFCSTELWSCSTHVFYREQNSMKTALFHPKEIWVPIIFFFFRCCYQWFLFLKLSSVARITFYFMWFSKCSGNLFPNFSTYGGGWWMLHIKLCQVPDEPSFWWAARFRLPPPSLQTAPFSGPLDSSFVILNEWCVSA